MLLAFIALSIYGTVFLQDTYPEQYGLIALGTAGATFAVQMVLIAVECDKKAGRIALLALAGVLLAVTVWCVLMLPLAQTSCLYIAMGVAALSLVIAYLRHCRLDVAVTLTDGWLIFHSAMDLAVELFGWSGVAAADQFATKWIAGALLAGTVLAVLAGIVKGIIDHIKK